MEFLDKMVLYRDQMAKYKAGTKDYWHWRELIKQLRFYAIERNIDVYTLEFDARNTINNRTYNRENREWNEDLNQAFLERNGELSKPFPDKVKIVQLDKEIENLKKKIYDNEVRITNGITEAEKQFATNMIKEAYLVKEMVDLRRQFDTATEAEKKTLRVRAEQIRIEVVAVLEDAGELAYRSDWERRAWLMYTGEDYGPPKFGEKDTRTDQQKRDWTTHNNLMEVAYGKYKSYSGKTQDQVTTPDEQHEIIRRGTALRESNWYKNTYETFTGADMTVYFAFPGHKPIDVGTASLISYSTYREKKQIRTIGAINTRGITKGARTISGRIIFNIVREHIVEMIRQQIPYMAGIRYMMMDELPPFDILISFGNEYGAAAAAVIQGVTTVDEQKSFTVEDMIMENIFTYLARDLQVMKSIYAKYTDPYDPLLWGTSSFIPDGTEILGDFYPSELELTQAGNLLTNPEPFYGAVSGWNAELYDLMYAGVDSSSLVVEESGELAGNNNDTDRDEEDGEESSEEEKEENPKFSQKAHYLWLADPPNSKMDAIPFRYGGFAGLSDTSVVEHGMDRIWRDVTGVISSNSHNTNVRETHKILAEKIRDFAKNDSFRNTESPYEYTLKMYDGNLNKNKSVDTEYKVAVTWEYYVPKGVPKESGTKDIQGSKKKFYKSRSKKEMDKNATLSILGFWKKEMAWTDINKAFMTREKGSGVFATRWLNKISVTKAQHGLPARKDWAVGELTQVANYIAKNATHDGKPMISQEGKATILTIPKEGLKIDIRKLFAIPSTISTDGYRRLLHWDVLPVGVSVVIRFQYTPSDPSTPLLTTGDIRYFYIVLKKGKLSSGYSHSKNPLLATVDWDSSTDRQIWDDANYDDFFK